MEIHIKKYNELTADELYEILKLRSEVFVVEQNCIYQDLDDKDKRAYHVWITDETGIVACARVLERGVSYDDAVSIGRVVSKRRGEGLGAAVMETAVNTAREKYGALPIIISAQQYAVPFYERFGFVAVSEPYLEDNIPHVKMIRGIN